MKFSRQSFKVIKSMFVSVLMLIAFSLLAQCKGGLCAAKDDALNDADSDCYADLSDNCPVVYNPDQFDGDSDSQGEACDSDDTDGTVALIKDPTFGALISGSLNFESQYSAPGFSSSSNVLNLDDAECNYYVVGCEGYFIGFLNGGSFDNSVQNSSSEFGDKNSEYAIVNPFGFYGRPSSDCSAFGESSTRPPAVFCQKSANSTNVLAGYLTENPDVNNRLETCDVLNQFDIQAEFCN